MNYYVCFSNLHALQSCAISQGKRGICFYTDAVSEVFLKSEFNGRAVKINDVEGRMLAIISLFLKKKVSRKAVIYTGCKNQYFTSFLVNRFTKVELKLLDDGLSSYWPVASGWIHSIRIFRRKFVSRLLSLVGLTYFHETHIMSMDRDGERYLMFPDLFFLRDRASNVPLSLFITPKYISELVERAGFHGDSISGRGIYVASYGESIRGEISLTGSLGRSAADLFIFWHPRVAKRTQSYPLEIISFRANEVFSSVSSLVIFLGFSGFNGNINVIDKSGESEFGKFLLSKYWSPLSSICSLSIIENE